jgi:hypothetical protein
MRMPYCVTPSSELMAETARKIKVYDLDVSTAEQLSNAEPGLTGLAQGRPSFSENVTPESDSKGLKKEPVHGVKFSQPRI